MSRFKLEETTYEMSGYRPDFKIIDSDIFIGDEMREDGSVAYLHGIDEDAAKLMVKALEKQIAKTPIQSFYNEGDYNWECKNCEQIVDEGQNYCHHCGQKLVEWD